ncbi:MAG: EAL domain-containing protein [Giesbergeria sp.]|uniref:putative bifunctional diguanylate cyclase/phosphodiesterase n=1 Tax=Giesbergeria sp. TaxID=2818473 RepID=UPI002636916D|nr:EAL domain-containing protein [Giesbergeria sp.]MDD2609132.1 EAL domain-containing protein [Giesbergeria sp.]
MHIFDLPTLRDSSSQTTASPRRCPFHHTGAQPVYAENLREVPGGWLEQVAMQAAPDGILLVDREGTIIMANPAMQIISGYSAEELIGQSVSMLLAPHLGPKHGQQMRSYFQNPNRRPMGMGHDLWLHRKDSNLIPVDVALGHSDAYGGAAVAFVRDISEVKRLQAQTSYQAAHDNLTGLVNRWQFSQRLEQAIQRGDNEGQAFALLLLDLDDFKAINDGYGHAAGDQVLVEVARRLKSVLRAGDVVGRLGGDEFTVLLPVLSHAQEAQSIAAQLLQLLQQPYRVQGFELQCGASAGVAMFPHDARDAETLLRYADMAMYHSKDRGRGHYALYAPPMGEKMAEKVLLHDRLKLALAYGGLSLHYQPQVDVFSGEVIGAEALLRWTDPNLGEVPPSRFIPVAEATGLILPLGQWVLNAVCRQILAWQQAGTPLRVAVNVSVQQLQQADWPEQLQETLQRHGVPADLLELELTESEAMSDPVLARQSLARIQALGISVTLDDFGTGHSSLAYVQQLPISRIKIARDFIEPMLQGESQAALVRAVIDLSHTLGLTVVAEGVESTEQLRRLHRYGCDIVQGWLYAKAVPAQEMQRWMGRPISFAALCAAASCPTP